mmetsp:Transcript_1182/g.3185  ORF Transcript_1182/g.3185 Transcript_1182/m.3185 type:complete len:229 (-) Transcript_1182:43-729(-)
MKQGHKLLHLKKVHLAVGASAGLAVKALVLRCWELEPRLQDRRKRYQLPAVNGAALIRIHTPEEHNRLCLEALVGAVAGICCSVAPLLLHNVHQTLGMPQLRSTPQEELIKFFTPAPWELGVVHGLSLTVVGRAGIQVILEEASRAAAGAPHQAAARALPRVRMRGHSRPPASEPRHRSAGRQHDRAETPCGHTAGSRAAAAAGGGGQWRLGLTLAGDAEGGRGHCQQ